MTSNLGIFGPFFVLGFWTFCVLAFVGVSRIRAGTQGLVRPADFAFGDSPRVPDQPRLANRNYMNLLELPVLFYAVCVVAFATATVTAAVVQVAWGYVFLRIVHSLIHLTTNNVLHRLFAFVASNTALLVLWIIIAHGLWGKSAA